MTARPLIAISTRPRAAGEVKGWIQTAAAAMQQTYLDAVWRAGANEMMVAPRRLDVDVACELLERADGLLLVGGGDIDPALYGAPQRHPAVYDVSAESDSLELSLARAALRLDVPMLAICRGMQVLNVAMGGTLHQHLGDLHGIGAHGSGSSGFASHPVAVAAGSRLGAAVGGASTIDACWSFHHQALDVVADGLTATARSDDGIIEACEADAASWAVAVQWHPERTAADDPVQQSLFDALVRAAVEGRRERRAPRPSPSRG